MESGTKRLKEKIRERLPVTGPQAASAYELVRWYCYHTNTHGCRRIVVSKGRLRRAAWVILTFGTVGIIFWQCALLIASYYTASVTITVQFQEITFPAVTICNINPYRYNATRHLFEKLDQATQIAIKELYHFMNSPNSSQARAQSEAIAEGQDDGLFQNIPLLRIELMDREYSIVSDLITKRRHRVNGTVKTQSFGTVNTQTRTKLVGFELCDKNNDKNSTCVIYTFNSGITAIQEWYHLHYLNIMAQVPQQTKLQMGYSADDLVFSCSFDGRPCDSRNFSLMHHPLHGNCFTFNGGENGSVLRTITGGSENGLKVTLHLDGNEYNPYLVTSMGAKIAIHDQHEQPFIEDVGIEIQTATETAMGLDMTVSQRLSSPYSDCTMDGLDVPVTNLYNKTYSLQMCLHSCFQMEMVRSCGCAHYEKPLPAEAEYCDYTKYPGWVACYYQLRDRFIQEQLVCQKICRPACHSKEWTMTISIAQWPSLPSEEWILRLLSWEKGLHGNRTLRKNELANLGIFYKDLNLRNISETAANNVVTLLSNFGGQLGLWMSCSVACIIEIVEVFFIDMFLIAARRGAQTARKWWRKEGEEPLTPRNAAHGTPVYIGDEDPPTFNSALQLPRPPVPGTLPCPPVPDTLLCTAAPDTLPRPPVPDMLPRPPVPDRLPRPPVPDTLPRPPVPDTLPRPPVPDTLLRPTVPDTLLHPTVPDTLLRPTVPDTLPRPPVPDTLPHPPVPDMLPHPPVPDTLPRPPVSDRLPRPPVPDRLPRPPVPDTLPRPPVPDTLLHPTVPDALLRPTVTDTLLRPPVPDTLPHPPVPDMLPHPPVPDMLPRPPVPDTLPPTYETLRIRSGFIPDTATTQSCSH